MFDTCKWYGRRWFELYTCHRHEPYTRTSSDYFQPTPLFAVNNYGKIIRVTLRRMKTKKKQEKKVELQSFPFAVKYI